MFFIVLSIKMYLHKLNFFYFPDPDLAINVDLGREEEEKNGRRKYYTNTLHKCLEIVLITVDIIHLYVYKKKKYQY